MVSTSVTTFDVDFGRFLTSNYPEMTLFKGLVDPYRHLRWPSERPQSKEQDIYFQKNDRNRDHGLLLFSLYRDERKQIKMSTN